MLSGLARESCGLLTPELGGVLAGLLVAAPGRSPVPPGGRPPALMPATVRPTYAACPAGKTGARFELEAIWLALEVLQLVLEVLQLQLRLETLHFVLVSASLLSLESVRLVIQGS